MSNDKEASPPELRMIPLDQIEVLNPRDRNNRMFEQIVSNIQSIGLKKPIVVTPRPNGTGDHYLLICGEGRFKAFKSLGHKEIPAMVMNVDDESAFIMSLTLLGVWRGTLFYPPDLQARWATSAGRTAHHSPAGHRTRARATRRQGSISARLGSRRHVELHHEGQHARHDPRRRSQRSSRRARTRESHYPNLA